MAALLRGQWDRLRAWLGEADALRHRGRPTGLGSWTVGDLVAHLGLGLGMLTEISPAPSDAAPLSLGRYVAAYPPAADTIAAQTRALAKDLGDDVLAGLDRIAIDAFHALSATDAHTVLGRRGALSRNDYLLTRLLELVVHGDDLHRVLPGTPSPVLPDAAQAVAAALSAAYRERSGRGPDVPSDLEWIRVATGRVPSADPHLPLL